MAKNLILKNVIYKFFLESFRLFIPLFTFPYIYRIFKPEIIGKIEFSQSISNYFFVFAGFGVYTYGLREISRVRNDEKQREELFTNLFIISIISSFLVAIVYLIYIFFKFDDNIILKKMLLLNSIHIISYIFYIEWINEAFENYKFISRKTIFIKILNLIFIFILIKGENDFYKYLFLLNIFIFFNNFISFIYIKKYVKFNIKKLKIRKYLFPLGMILLISNVNILYTQLDKIALGFYSKQIEEVAYYSVGQKIMSVFMALIMSIISVTIPRLSFYLGQNRRKEYVDMFNEIFSFIYFLIFPLGIGMIVLSKEMALFFGGNKYLSAQVTICMFGIRIIFVVIETILSHYVIFLNQKEKIMANIYMICGIFNFLMKYLLIKYNYFNATSAILTTTIAEIMIIILNYYYINKYLKLNLKIFKIKNLKYFIFSMTFFIFNYFIKILNLKMVVHFISVFLLCGMFYIILLALVKDECIKKIFNKLQEIKNF